MLCQNTYITVGEEGTGKPYREIFKQDPIVNVV